MDDLTLQFQTTVCVLVLQYTVVKAVEANIAHHFNDIMGFDVDMYHTVTTTLVAPKSNFTHCSPNQIDLTINDK